MLFFVILYMILTYTLMSFRGEAVVLPEQSRDIDEYIDTVVKSKLPIDNAVRYLVGNGVDYDALSGNQEANDKLRDLYGNQFGDLVSKLYDASPQKPGTKSPAPGLRLVPPSVETAARGQETAVAEIDKRDLRADVEKVIEAYAAAPSDRAFRDTLKELNRQGYRVRGALDVIANPQLLQEAGIKADDRLIKGAGTFKG